MENGSKSGSIWELLHVLSCCYLVLPSRKEPHGPGFRPYRSDGFLYRSMVFRVHEIVFKVVVCEQIPKKHHETCPGLGLVHILTSFLSTPGTPGGPSGSETPSVDFFLSTKPVCHNAGRPNVWNREMFTYPPK